MIDFGWAINSQDKNPITPIDLGDKYKFSEGQFSDVYSVGKSVKKKFKYINYINHFVKKTSEINPEFYNNKPELLKRLNELKSAYKTHKFTPLDHILLVIKRIEVVTKILIKKIKV